MQGHFSVESVDDENGNVLFFSALVGNLSSDVSAHPEDG